MLSNTNSSLKKLDHSLICSEQPDSILTTHNLRINSLPRSNSVLSSVRSNSDSRNEDGSSMRNETKDSYGTKKLSLPLNNRYEIGKKISISYNKARNVNYA